MRTIPRPRKTTAPKQQVGNDLPSWMQLLFDLYPYLKNRAKTYRLVFAGEDEEVLIKAIIHLSKTATGFVDHEKLWSAITAVGTPADNTDMQRNRVMLERKKLYERAYAGDFDKKAFEALIATCERFEFWDTKTGIERFMKRFRQDQQSPKQAHIEAMARLGYEVKSDLDDIVTFRHTDDETEVVSLH